MRIYMREGFWAKDWWLSCLHILSSSHLLNAWLVQCIEMFTAWHIFLFAEDGQSHSVNNLLSFWRKSGKLQIHWNRKKSKDSVTWALELASRNSTQSIFMKHCVSCNQCNRKDMVYTVCIWDKKHCVSWNSATGKTWCMYIWNTFCFYILCWSNIKEYMSELNKTIQFCAEATLFVTK